MVPNGEQKLARHWVDYTAAGSPGFETASEAVITMFWVRRGFKLRSYIVDSPTMLTHYSHNLSMHVYRDSIGCFRGFDE